MSEPQLGEVIKDITRDVQAIVRGEIELAKAELLPQAKRLGSGRACSARPATWALQAVTLLFICVGLTFSALFSMVAARLGVRAGLPDAGHRWCSSSCS
jgi:hypothetical protein